MSKNNPHNIKVGDTLWSVHYIKHTPHFREYEVSKVGSKYAKAGRYLVNLLTLKEKGDFDFQQFETSKELLMEMIHRQKAIGELHRHSFRWKANNLTSAQINRINEVLQGVRPYSDLAFQQANTCQREGCSGPVNLKGQTCCADCLALAERRT